MEAHALRLISWNVNGRIERLRDQVAALRERQPDIVALQEARSTTVPGLKAELHRIGLEHSVDSFSLAADRTVLTGHRQYGELMASRWSLSTLPPDAFRVPWTERVLSALVESPWGVIEIHTAHIPPGSTNGWKKIEMFEGIYERLACICDRSRILCGDFNTPQKEMPDGQIVTWGQDEVDGKFVCWGFWRGDTGKRWDRGERDILHGLAKFDLPDMYRTLHGYGAEDFSWYWKGKERHIGRRFDHVFASRDLNPVRCQYLHSLREAGLSEHSAIEVDFEPWNARAHS
jgi:exodeoxyribonuclease III